MYVATAPLNNSLDDMIGVLNTGREYRTISA